MKSAIYQSSTQMGILLSHIFQELESTKIRYCVLRNYKELPDFTTNDVDILVDSKDISDCLQLIHGIARNKGWYLVRVIQSFDFYKLYFYWNEPINSNENRVVELDLWFNDNHWRGIPRISTNVILDNRQIYRGFWVASPGGEVADAFSKEYLAYGTVGFGSKAKKYKATFPSLVSGDRDTFIATLAPFYGRELTNQLADRIIAGDWDILESQVNTVRKQLIKHTIRHSLIPQLRRWINYVRLRWLDKIMHPTGFFIAFLGPDGSGKTTISNAFQKIIEENLGKAFNRTRYFHGRFGVFPELKAYYNKVASIIRFPTKKKLTTTQATQLLDKPPMHPIQAFIYLTYYTTEYLYGYVLLRRFMSKGEIVLFDRYYYDYLVHTTYSRIPSSLRWWLLRIVPTPQLLVYLKGDATIIHTRKPELRPDQIEAQQLICEQIIKKTPNSTICQSDVDIDHTVNQVFDTFLQHLVHQSEVKLKG